MNKEIYVARILYPVKVLGLGNRIGIWMAGCEHQCKGCSNPELWIKKNQYKTSINDILDMINILNENHQVDGFTITGGDPFFQPEALNELLKSLKKVTSDILVYTGYDYEFLKNKYPETLEYIAVLIDGKYIKEKNDGSFLRGSNNQRIFVLNEKYKTIYKNYIENGKNEIQNFIASDGIVSVGIHNKDFNERLKKLMEKKGLEEYE